DDAGHLRELPAGRAGKLEVVEEVGEHADVGSVAIGEGIERQRDAAVLKQGLEVLETAGQASVPGEDSVEERADLGEALPGGRLQLGEPGPQREQVDVLLEEAGDALVAEPAAAGGVGVEALDAL